MNLFTIKNRLAIHLATNSVIIALSESCSNQSVRLNALYLNQMIMAKPVYLAHATYNLNELKLL